jgi:L-fuculose-phosphate aldolase
MDGKFVTERAAVARAAREMERLDLVSGSSGNVSLRIGGEGLMAITPMGVPYSGMDESDIVVVDSDLEPLEGDLPPSSESLLHQDIYARREDVAAVVHTHSVFSSVAAVIGREIPPILDEMVVYIGGGIRVSEYAFPGTQELAESVCEALEERSAALIRNHGAVGVGSTVEEALRVCALVERVAKIHTYAAMSGRVDTLPSAVIEREQAVYKMKREAARVHISRGSAGP